MQVLKLFFVALCTFLITDAIWLGLVAKVWYIKEYNPWLRLENNQLYPLWWAVIIVYLLLTLFVIVFVMPLAKESLPSALFYGATMGFIVYGVYDFTCLAIFKDFPVGIAFADWVWGTFVCAWVSMVACYFSRLL